MLLNGAAHPVPFPISDGAGNVQPQSWLVETPPALELKELTFSGMPAAVVQDDGSAYPLPHWQQSDDSDYVPSPVMYVRGDTMTVTVTFQTIPNDGGGTLYVKGDGPGNLDFGPTAVSVSGGTVTIPLTSTNAFADEVEFFDPLAIVWSYGLTASGPWKEVGTSENQVYVTLGAPATSPVYHTLVHLGCKNAEGQKTIEGALPLIWDEFTDKNVRRMDGEQLTYYGKSEYFFIDSTAGLLQYGDGICTAWAKFFIDILKVQGIDFPEELSQVFYIYPTGGGLQGRFLIKKWEFTEEGTSSDPQYPYRLTGLHFISNTTSSDIPNWQYAWQESDSDIADITGIPGQGNPNPASLFTQHYVVLINETVYDPSYGKRYEPFEEGGNPFIGMEEVIAGYGYQEKDQSNYYFQWNVPADHSEFENQSFVHIEKEY